MSFPTPYDCFIRDFNKYFELLEKDFKEPKKLSNHLDSLDRLLKRDESIITSKEVNLGLSTEEKQSVVTILDKLDSKLKSSAEKINWSNNFSSFLQEQEYRK
jgi:flagellar biosynthesis/type III secretory pathway chaperone